MTVRVHPRAPWTGWAPTSPCGPDCRPVERGPVAALPLVAWRMVALVAVVLATLVMAPFVPPSARVRWLRARCAAALRASGVRLRVTGSVAGGGVLLVSNHMSWIEILGVGAVHPVRMIAKLEVRDWPLIGGVAARSGALFVDRAGLRSLPATVAATADALRAGDVVGVFPEGTTWCGAAAGEFRRAAFQAAIDAGAPVVPVAVVLRPPGGAPTADATFIGEETLWDALMRVLRMPALECSLTVLPPLAPGADRKDLARRAAEAVASVTGVPHPVSGAPRTTAPAVAA
ncbi:lysophospholipid acyltransferase family protein [Pseudonocardia aurantiaca]|uniref:Lysophospholipid acyltransferase family protein n=1 Tax=Pseudonocardia aurantiaca TaxID=75290 RepID=A0ABW4FNV3_9PSEU